MTESDVLLQVDKLEKRYRGKLFRKGFQAVDGVSIEVGRGTVFGLLGPNGAGKTTLIKVLLGLVKKTKGEAKLFGRPAGDPSARRRVGYLPEAHRLPLYLTGKQVMNLFGQMCGADRATMKRTVPELLGRVGMESAANRKVREYSKGMQQRLGLAQAMVHDPDLIFLDEPTDGVDPVGRKAIRQVISDLKGAGKTIFINSHLLLEVEMMCNRVVIMDKGRILREGTIEELTPRTGAVHFTLEQSPDNLEQLLEGVGQNFRREETGFQLMLSTPEQDRTIDILRGAGVSIRSIEARRVNLEEAFIDLIGEDRK